MSVGTWSNFKISENQNNTKVGFLGALPLDHPIRNIKLVMGIQTFPKHPVEICLHVKVHRLHPCNDYIGEQRNYLTQKKLATLKIRSFM